MTIVSTASPSESSAPVLDRTISAAPADERDAEAAAVDVSQAVALGRGLR